MGAEALAIVGNAGGTNVGESLRRAAIAAGHKLLFFNAYDAAGPRVLRSLSWHFGDRQPPRLGRFSAQVVRNCAKAPPDILIATGAAPLTGSAMRRLRAMGIFGVNYSTDDPWNPATRADWYLRALPEYDLVFTTRRANIDDFRRLGCAEVHYLAFGYDPDLFQPGEEPAAGPVHDILFVGGADRDRVAFMTEFMRSGPQVALVGGYWERFPAMRPHALGQRSPEALCALTAAAKVNLCLVRHANRDGHVMRSFEIAAIGGCMLAEATEEHREIFGEDGDCVVYFRTPQQAVERARALLDDPAGRARLAFALRTRIATGAHTYRDRLGAMLHAAREISSKAEGARLMCAGRRSAPG